MNLTRRSLFASAVALLALPRRVAAERLLGPVDPEWPPEPVLPPFGKVFRSLADEGATMHLAWWGYVFVAADMGGRVHVHRFAQPSGFYGNGVGDLLGLAK